MNHPAEEIFILLTLPIAIPMNILLEKMWRKGKLDWLPYKPRIIHWIIATWGGFFWLPCELCGKKFGGHEKHGTLYYSAFSGASVCIKCADKAKEHYMKNREIFDQQRGRKNLE